MISPPSPVRRRPARASFARRPLSAPLPDRSGRTSRYIYLRSLPPIALLLLLAAAADRAPSAALINESPSIARGIYLRVSGGPIRGAVVALAPPPSARSYLRSQNAPADLRLLKRVAAIAGDHVCVDDRGLIAPHRLVPIQGRDGRGGSLPSWVGCGPMGEGEILVLGDTVGSFVSRYFGPVKTEHLDGVFRPLLTW